jgi:IclR family transcriptional regulator, pca regulon regulatory protein
MASEKNPREDGEYINSLARGLSVLRAFSKERPEMTLSEIAAATELSPAVARRCLHTLIHLGYVGKQGKLFLLRPEVITFASAYLQSMNVEEIVQPHLQIVRDKTGDSSSLAVLSGPDILYLVHVSTNRMIRLAAGVGTRFPAYATSLGRVLLAWLPGAGLDAFFKGTELRAFTDRTTTSIAQLKQILRKVRRDGFASIQDELDYGIVSVAVPVHGDQGQILAAINCSTATTRITQKEMVTSRLPVLRDAAHRIELELRRYPVLAHSVAR